MRLFAFIALLVLGSCQSNSREKTNLSQEKVVESKNNHNEIHSLIIDVLIWSDTISNLDLIPMSADSTETYYVQIDQTGLKTTAKLISETNFFSRNFVSNYRLLVNELGKNISTDEFGKWLVGEMPPTKFASDSSPWCKCQDNLDWKNIEIIPENQNESEGEYIWTWGERDDLGNRIWKNFEYHFKVVLEDGLWKIDYLEGFDLEKNIN